MDILYTIVLVLHSLLRWGVLLLGLLVIIRALNGISFKRGFTGQDQKFAGAFTGLMDLQLLLGLLLYFVLSPLTRLGLQNFAGAMSNDQSRFFMIEHFFIMFIAVVVAHVGRSMTKRATNAASKHRRTAIWFAVSLLLVLAAIPWPFLEYGRPLLRLPF